MTGSFLLFNQQYSIEVVTVPKTLKSKVPRTIDHSIGKRRIHRYHDKLDVRTTTNSSMERSNLSGITILHIETGK